MLNQISFRRKKQGVLEPKTGLFELKIVAFFEKENGTFEKKMTYFQKKDDHPFGRRPGCQHSETRV
jgi:hypothetical protein